MATFYADGQFELLLARGIGSLAYHSSRSLGLLVSVNLIIDPSVQGSISSCYRSDVRSMYDNYT